MTNQEPTKMVSNCCGALVYPAVGCNTNEIDSGPSFWECSKCGESCAVVPASDSPTKSRYVVGFLINDGMVALIHKNRPAWQQGLLNGIGGHIEPGETPLEAMRREFQEEAGADVTYWRQFVLIKGSSYELYCFTSREPHNIETKTDEVVEWFWLFNLTEKPIIENLKWLVPMADYPELLTGEIIHENPQCPKPEVPHV